MKRLLLSILVVVAAACGGKKSDPPAGGSGSASGSGTAAADPSADYVRILGHHNPGKPTDPVIIDIQKFQVVKASFDPAKIEGGTAQLTLDLASLRSSSPKRDKHLSSEDYLDVGKFATATIDVDNVKKTGERTYSADATVSIHGVVKKLPVSFEVVETLPDGIRIHAKQAWHRGDFSIGMAEGPDETTADAQEIELQLTLKRS